MQHRLQIPQGLTTDCRHCRQLHSVTNRRIEHPLRDLQESTFGALFYATEEQSTPIPRKGTVDRHHAVVPRMPRVTDFSRFSTMGVALSTCTTRTELTLDLEKTLLAVEFQPQRLRVAVRLSLCHDSVGCITAISRGLTPRSELGVFAVGMAARPTRGSWQFTSPA